MSCTIKTAALTLGLIALIGSFFYFSHNNNSLPKIAIANYGPHISLEETIQGTKEELLRLGLKEHENIRFEILDVNFEPSLIMQMLAKLKASKPAVLVALTTPVAQAAKGSIKELPIVFSAITSPMDAGLLSGGSNITGASDKQDLKTFLQFATALLPKAKSIGILYATGEANDAVLVNMMKQAAIPFGMNVLAIPIEQAKDVPMRMQGFRGKVDLIYVGVSGPIQPSLPAIVHEANRMHIPLFNADANAVKQHQVLGSYGVSYYQVGVNTARLIHQIFQGKDISTLPPLYPSAADHHGYISKKIAQKLDIDIPTNLTAVTIVE